MKKRMTIIGITFMAAMVLSEAAMPMNRTTPLIIDHLSTDLSLVSDDAVLKAKKTLKIAYGHTSHGSQIVTGMTGLVGFKGSLYSFSGNGANDSLELRDTPFSTAYDLGNPDRVSWESATRTYLAAHPDINVIVWSWCGQAGSASEAEINSYCSLMTGLENDFPSVVFVYMTGHLDGSGLTGNLHKRNEQIRKYCRDNNKVLFDFADIESYNPDGVYFGDKKPNDNCDYDSDGNGSLDANWAIEWQNAHPGKWYECSAAHSQPLNGNLKAYAAWRLWTEIADFIDPTPTSVDESSPQTFSLTECFPNPFNGSTHIGMTLDAPLSVRIDIYSVTGQKIRTLTAGMFESGFYSIAWNGTNDAGEMVSNGIYFCRAALSDGLTVNRKMVFLK